MRDNIRVICMAVAVVSFWSILGNIAVNTEGVSWVFGIFAAIGGGATSGMYFCWEARVK